MQRSHLPATTPATYTKLILAAPCTISRGTPTKSWRTTLRPRCSILQQGKTTVVLFSNSSSPFSTTETQISWKENQIAPASHKYTNAGKNSDSRKTQTQSCNVSSLLAAFIFFISTQILSAKDLIQCLVLSQTFFLFCFKKLNDLSKKSSKMAAEPGTEARNLTCSSLHPS